MIIKGFDYNASITQDSLGYILVAIETNDGRRFTEKFPATPLFISTVSSEINRAASFGVPATMLKQELSDIHQKVNEVNALNNEVVIR